MNMANLLSAAAERNPRKTAIILENECVSYEQLDRSTTSLAQWFLRHGCKPGDRIAFHWPNSIETVKLFFACFKAGMIAVPVNVRMKPPEIAYVLHHSKAVMYFAHPDLASVAKEAREGCAGLRKIHSTLEGLNEGDPDVPLPDVNDHDPALLLYTSGTTARPKGVTHTHRTLLENVKLVCIAAPDSLQTALVMTQMAYISAICIVLLPAIVTGGTCVLVPAFDAQLVLDSIERFQCSYAFGLPSMVQLLLEEQARKPREVRSLRTFVAGGDCVPVSTQERFQALFGIPVREAYGMTETGPSVFNPADDRQGLPQRRGSEADEGVRSAQLHSGEETEGAAELGGQTGRTASGVREPAAGAGRVRQEFTAAPRRIGRAQLRALLRDGRDAALPSARAQKHSEAAGRSCGRIQSKPDPSPTTGRGHAAGVEEPLRQACFDPLLTLHVSDKSEAALQKPNLCIRCQVLREIAYPTTSPDLHEIRYLHPGLLRSERG